MTNEPTITTDIKAIELLWPTFSDWVCIIWALPESERMKLKITSREETREVIANVMHELCAKIQLSAVVLFGIDYESPFFYTFDGWDTRLELKPFGYRNPDEVLPVMH